MLSLPPNSLSACMQSCQSGRDCTNINVNTYTKYFALKNRLKVMLDCRHHYISDSCKVDVTWQCFQGCRLPVNFSQFRQNIGQCEDSDWRRLFSQISLAIYSKQYRDKGRTSTAQPRYSAQSGKMNDLVQSCASFYTTVSFLIGMIPRLIEGKQDSCRDIIFTSLIKDSKPCVLDMSAANPCAIECSQLYDIYYTYWVRKAQSMPVNSF